MTTDKPLTHLITGRKIKQDFHKQQDGRGQLQRRGVGCSGEGEALRQRWWGTQVRRAGGGCVTGDRVTGEGDRRKVDGGEETQ